ncbi:hypothetical protein [Pseudomonas aeruginosa]|uniref:hypothetical protein n=1 Tax=Pseudomonas aeruginosa TaxID=287 RepID=UPI00402BD3C4
MSKQSTSFEIGFALGSVVREFRRALSRPPVVVHAQAPVASSVQRIEPAMLAGPTAKELEHISDVPACGFHADSDTHSTRIRTVIPR